MAESVAKQLKEAKLKSLEAGSPLRIGVLTTMEHTVIPAIEALKRKGMEGACNLLRIALQVLTVKFFLYQFLL